MTARARTLDRLLEAAFRLRPGEVRPTLLMFLGCLSTVGAFIVGRSVRDTLFLTHLSSRQLPQMYAWSSLAVALSGALFARLAARHRPERLLPWTGAAFALSVLLARAALPAGTWVVYALYVWVEVLGSVTVIQFWTLANEAYDAREARRLFALIGAGGTVANVVAGFAVRGLAGRLGAENLLFLCAALLLAGPVLVLPVARRARGAAAPAPAAPLGPRALAASPHLRLLAALTLFTFLATTFVDYQFKAAAADHFGRDRDAMAAFFGSFFGVAGVLALAVQVAVTARVLERLGLTAALLLLPAFLGAGSLLALAVPVLWTAAAAKGADTVFRYTVTDASSQLLYLPLAPGQRRHAKAFLDGVLKPATIALAGLLLAAWRSVGESSAPVAVAALACVLAWMGTLRGLRGEYLTSLRRNLRRRLQDVRAGEPFSEDAALVLRRALSSPEARDVEAALELLPGVPGDFAAEVGRHLGHPSPRARRLACQAAGRAGDLSFAGALLRLLQDPAPEVRAAAAGAFCAVARDQAVKPVRPLLADPDPGVRAGAVSGLMRHGGLDGILCAAETLKALLASPAPAEREQAALALAAVGARNFYQPVLALLADPDPSVRRAGLEAAAAVRAPELVPALVYRLARRETAQAAAEALAAYGPGTERVLAKVLANPSEDAAIRRNAPLALGQLATPEAASLLALHLDDPDAALRRQADLALSRLARLHPEVPIPGERVRRAALLELERAYRALAAAEALGLDPDPAGAPGSGDARAAARHVVAWALSERVEQAAERACHLMSALHPGADLDLALANLRDPAPGRRASALEILDAVLDRGLKRRLVPLLDGRSRAAALREGAAFFAVPRRDAQAWLAALLGDDSPWIAAAALGLAAAEGMAVSPGGLEVMLGHPVPYVREAAFLATLRLAPEADRVAAARRLAADPFPPLRGRASALARAAEATGRKVTA